MHAECWRQQGYGWYQGRTTLLFVMLRQHVGRRGDQRQHRHQGLGHGCSAAGCRSLNRGGAGHCTPGWGVRAATEGAELEKPHGRCCIASPSTNAVPGRWCCLLGPIGHGAATPAERQPAHQRAPPPPQPPPQGWARAGRPRAQGWAPRLPAARRRSAGGKRMDCIRQVWLLQVPAGPPRQPPAPFNGPYNPAAHLAHDTSSQRMKNSVASCPREVESPSNASRRSLEHASLSCTRRVVGGLREGRGCVNLG